MANRYLNLFKLPERLYAKGSPIIIEAGALHKDSVLGDVVAQLKFRSIVKKRISSLTVEITCYNAAKEIINPTFIYEYENIIVNENEHFFGSKTLITLPNNDTRSFSVKITNVEFSDGSTVIITENQWNSIPKQNDLTSFDNVFVEYFTKKYGIAANVLPTEYNDLWLCTCGQENKKDEIVCKRCGIKNSVVFPFDIEQEKKNAIYEFAKEKMNSCLYGEAVEFFEAIAGWKDADEQIIACQRKIEEIKAKVEAECLEKERKAEIERKEAERIEKRNKKIAIITTPIVCAIIAFIIVLNTVIIPNSKYSDAIALMNAEKYAEAIAIFEELDGHKDSNIKIEECKYDNAVSHMKDGKLDEAYKIFTELDDFKDSNKRASEIRLTVSKESIKNVKVGSYIKFGMYDLDYDDLNGKEYIDWLVLEVKNGQALLISKYSIGTDPYNKYNKGYTEVTWETCTLRKWLNNDFINTAFTMEEKKMIPVMTISADKGSEDTNPGNPTKDQIFLLSTTEVFKYFSSGRERQCTPYWDHDFSEWWWLRSPGKDRTYVDCVTYEGSVSGYTHNTWDNLAVRPAMWIDLSKII